MIAVLWKHRASARLLGGVLTAALILAQGVEARRQTKVRSLDVSVQDPRPLAKVLDEIEQQFGWVVTYEDPPYEHVSETEDVTSQVRRDGKTHPRVIGPRGGAFHFSYALPADPEVTVDPSTLLDALMTRYAASGNLGFFRSFREGSSFHVVPSKLVSAAGGVVERGSVLDSVISIEPGERKLLEVVRSIAAGVGASSGTQVIVGAVPLNLLLRVPVRVDAGKESARTMLTRYLAATGRQVSWRLLYDPGMKLYALNLHVLPAGDRR